MGRGRPVGSIIRQRMVDILSIMKRAHGYQLFKAYRDLFPKVTLRVIYYHLKKGVSTGEFILDKIEREKGDYSWGGEAEKIYYSLGKDAKPKSDKTIQDYFAKRSHH